MFRYNKIRILTAVFFFIQFFSCGVLKDSLVQYNINPNDAKRYNPDGVMFFGTLETPETADVKGVTIFYESAPDLYMPTFTTASKQPPIFTYLSDVSSSNTMISRFSVRYSKDGFPQEKIVIQSYHYKIPDRMDSKLQTITNVDEKITTNTSYLLIMSPVKNGGSQIITNNVWNIQTNRNTNFTSVRYIFYAGRFSVLHKKSFIDDFEYYIRYTNCFDEDKELFKQKYSDISNYILVPLTVDKTN